MDGTGPPTTPRRKKPASGLLARVPKAILDAEERARNMGGVKVLPTGLVGMRSRMDSSDSGVHSDGDVAWTSAHTPAMESSTPLFSPHSVSTIQTTPDARSRTILSTSDIESLPFDMGSPDRHSQVRKGHTSLPVSEVSRVIADTGATLGSENARPSSSMGWRMSAAIDDSAIMQLLNDMGHSHGKTLPDQAEWNDDQSQGGERLHMLDNNGDEFSIVEHALSPVEERTEVSTAVSSKAPSMKRPFDSAQTYLHDRLNSRTPQITSLHTAPLTLSPKHHTSPFPRPSSSTSTRLATQALTTDAHKKSQLFGSASHERSASLDSRQGTPLDANPAFAQQFPRKTAGLIAMFEPGASFSTPPPMPSRSPVKSIKANGATPRTSIKETDAAMMALEKSRKARESRTQRQFASESALLDLATSDEHVSPPTSSFQFPKSLSTPLVSDHTPKWMPVVGPGLVHRKSISRSLASSVGEAPVVHHGPLWWRDHLAPPASCRAWQKCKAILTTDGLYLSLGKSAAVETMEFSLEGCVSVESVRGKKAYSPDPSEANLHIFKMTWATTREEMFGCERPTSRADWVGHVWQAAHDFGGFVDQPDVPLAESSMSSAGALTPQRDFTPAPSGLSVNQFTARALSTVSSPTQISPTPQTQTMISVSTIATTDATSSLGSELRRDVLALDGTSTPSHLYSSDHGQHLRDSLRHLTEGSITEISPSDSVSQISAVPTSLPGLAPVPLPPPSSYEPKPATTPALDIFAMLDRTKAQAPTRTSQFYDSPPTSDVRRPQPVRPQSQTHITCMESAASRPTSAIGSVPGTTFDNPSIVNSQRYSLHDPGPVHQAPRMSAIHSPSVRLGLEQPSIHADLDSNAPLPARAVKRDLERILTTIGRKNSAGSAKDLELHLDSIHSQLQGVAEKLKGEDGQVASTSQSVDGEPSVADKVDYMLSLCNILLESQHKVSAAVEKSLHAHGVSVEPPTRNQSSVSHRAQRNLSTRSSMPSDLRSRAQSFAQQSNLVFSESTTSTPSVNHEVPLEQVAESNADEEVDPEAMPEPGQVQEAGLSRIENLLAAIVCRLDDQTAQVTTTRDTVALTDRPRLPEKVPSIMPEFEPPTRPNTVGDGVSINNPSLYTMLDSHRHSFIDIDADVALWKSRERDSEYPFPITPPVEAVAEPKRPPSKAEPPPVIEVKVQVEHAPPVPEKAPSTYSLTSMIAPSVKPRERNFNSIVTHRMEDIPPTPPPQFTAEVPTIRTPEDQAASRIAEERMKAARILEGDSRAVPEKSQSRVFSLAPNQIEITQPEMGRPLSQAPLPPKVTTPRQLPTPLPRGAESASMPGQRSSQFLSRPGNQAPERRVSFAASSSGQSGTGSVTSIGQPSSQASITPSLLLEDVRAIIYEGLQNHSTETQPTFEEMIRLLGVAQETGKTTMDHQADVSKYLAQLNNFWEGDLQKRSDEWNQVSTSIARMQDQIYLLAERTALALANPPVQPTAPTITVAPPTEGSVRHSVAGDVDASTIDEVDGDLIEDPADPQAATDPAKHRPSRFLSMTQGVQGPRSRTIQLGNGPNDGPRLPAFMGRMWGSLDPGAGGERAARWSPGAARVAGWSGQVAMSGARYAGGGPPDGADLLPNTDPNNPDGEEVLMTDEAIQEQVENGDLQKAGTIALGISHILKLLQEQAAREEERNLMEAERLEEAGTKGAPVSEYEERKLQLEELRAKRDTVLAEDKAQHVESLIASLKKQTTEQDKLLRQIAADLESSRKKPEENEEEKEESESKLAEITEHSHKVLEELRQGVAEHIDDFKAKLTEEVKEMLSQVGELREQKQMLQGDIAQLFEFKAKHGGGAPDAHWYSPVPSMEAMMMGQGQGNLDYPYPSPTMDRDVDTRSVGRSVGRSVAAPPSTGRPAASGPPPPASVRGTGGVFGPRPPR